MRRRELEIVGESRHQEAIAEAAAGDAVQLVHNPANPHDVRAIEVRDQAGRMLGHLPRGGWVTRALLDEGRSVTATIKLITGEGRAMRGVVLWVLASSPPPRPAGQPRARIEPDAPRQTVWDRAAQAALAAQRGGKSAKSGCSLVLGLVLVPAALALLTPGARAAPDASAARVEADARAVCAERWPDDYALRGGCIRNAREGAESWRTIRAEHPGLARALDRCVTKWLRGGYVNWALAGGCARNQLDGWREEGGE